MYCMCVHCYQHESGLHPPGLLQLLLRVFESSEAVVALMPSNRSVESPSPLRWSLRCLYTCFEILHVLNGQAAGLQHVPHRAQDIVCVQGEAH